MDPLLLVNRDNWDDRVPIHVRNATGFYGVDRLRAGGITLHRLEMGEVGSFAGLRVLHLQCHFGLDTLSMARLGAVPTGLDFSAPAIAAARALAAETGLSARFVEAEATTAREAVDGFFDLVYASWGAWCWIPRLAPWVKAAADCLAPGGRLYVADAHPFLYQTETVGDRLEIRYDRVTPIDRPLVFEDGTTYTGDTTPLAHTRTHEWNHPVSEMLDAVASAGLGLDFLHEHDMLPWPFAPWMVAAGMDGMFALPPGMPRLPLAFSLMARK